MKQALAFLALLLFFCGNATGEHRQAVGFLSTHALKEHLNSDDTEKAASAVSYIAGIADYLIKIRVICPPEGASVSEAASIVKEDLDMDSYEYRQLTAATPVELALRLEWGCN